MGLRDAAWLLQVVGDASRDVVIVKDVNGCVVYANSQAARMLGMPAEELVGSSDRDWPLPSDEIRAIRTGDRQVMVTEEPVVVLESLTGPDNVIRTYRASKVPLRDPTGEVVGVRVCATDVTDVRETSVALSRQQERLVATLDALTEGFCAVDSANRLTVLNRASEQFFGVSREEVLQQRIDEVVPEFHANGLAAICRQVRAERRPAVTEVPVTTEQERVYTVRVAPATRDALAITMSDVTEQHRAVAGLRDSEARFRALAEQLPALIWVTDAAGRNIYTNPEYQRWLGVTDTDLAEVGWQSIVHPDDLPRVTRAWQESARMRSLYREHVRLRLPGGGYNWLMVRAVPLLDDAGEVRQWIGTGLDIDEQVRMADALRASQHELQELADDLAATVRQRTAELVHQRKVDVIGQLTGGIAHDFSNLLTPILSTLEVLHETDGLDERRRILVGSALRSADRARVMVTRLLRFARRQDLQAKVIAADAVVAELSELLEHTLGPHVRLVSTRESGHDGWCTVDPQQLELALLNLCINARDAMPDGGELQVSVGVQQAPAEGLSLAAGDYVVVSVTDSGAGMDPDTLAQATDPFFTTKKPGHGTGLGLSMVDGLAAGSGGALRLQSDPGRGTRAELWLPAAQPPSGSQIIPPARTAEPRPSLNLLLVDDDDDARQGIADMLRGLGHDVTDTGSPVEALQWLTQPTIRFDGLITDRLMPQMDGLQLVERARADHPTLPVMVVSGGELPDLAGIPALAKPFRLNELWEAVNRMRAVRR